LFPEADRIVTSDDGMGAGVDWVLALVYTQFYAIYFHHFVSEEST
jgi:hypothetical protein